MAPRVLVSDELSETAVQIFRDRGVEVDYMPKLGTQELIQRVHVFGTAYAETTDRQFVPALDVWLRNERWTDELPRHPSRTQPQRLTRADENALEFERLYGGDQHGGTRSVQALDAGFGS